MGSAGDHCDLTTIQSAIAKDDTVSKLLFFFTRKKRFPLAFPSEDRCEFVTWNQRRKLPP